MMKMKRSTLKVKALGMDIEAIRLVEIIKYWLYTAKVRNHNKTVGIE